MKTFKEFVNESKQIDEEKSYASDEVVAKLKSIAKKMRKQNKRDFVQLLADRVSQHFPSTISRVELHNLALTDSKLDDLRKEVDMVDILGSVIRAVR